ncbi:MAG TPA: hypothetical protein VMK31_02045 [Sphingomicrobium sp.]|nr:hypothetical protein [Sphingomicrobium sp.]
MTWLWVLLALLLAALLLWWLLADDGEEQGLDALQGADTVAVETLDVGTAPMGGPVTDISMLIPAIAPEMVGREVRLDGVQVQEVVGDIGFWIGPNSDQRVFAVLSQEPTPATPTEGMVDVNAGAMADIAGTIRTRGEVLQGLAQGDVMNLPQGVDRFLVVENYQVLDQNQ